MSTKHLALYVLAIVAGNIAVWLQLYGRFVWKWLESHTSIIIFTGIPITYIFMKATEWGFEGFDEKMWPLRISGFAIGMIVFWFMTAYFMGQTPDLKTFISLGLCVLVILIQIFL